MHTTINVNISESSTKIKTLTNINYGSKPLVCFWQVPVALGLTCLLTIVTLVASNTLRSNGFDLDFVGSWPTLARLLKGNSIIFEISYRESAQIGGYLF